MSVRKFVRALGRRKGLQTTGSGGMARVLGTLDLTALGVGSTLGVGVYVLAGFVSRDAAGPSVILSFLVAAIASVLAGLCYAEFGARVPRAGSAYVYSYVTVGEFIAFIIGWNLILEYIIGAASVVRALSSYIDALAGNVIMDAMREAMPINVSFLSPYPDFFAFGLCVTFSIALAFGAKESSHLNNVFTLLNLSVVLYVIVTGLFKADISNWKVDPSQVDIDDENINIGKGGFFPFGLEGMLKGAATCFYAFIGFDCVATTGEEAKNPQRSIPIAIIGSLFIVFLAYFGVSAVLTLMWPYYLQDDKTPLPHVYSEIGWPVAKWIVSVGAIFGLFSSLMGALYPLPRIIYAMASDGLIFAWLGRIHPRFQTPFVGTLVAGTFTGLMAMLFDLDQLANMMAIGTLLAYSIVAACVMLLRYSVEQGDDPSWMAPEAAGPPPQKGARGGFAAVGRAAGRLLNRPALQRPTPASASTVTWCTTVFCVCCFGAAACLVHGFDGVKEGKAPLVFLVIFGATMILCVLSVALQPTNSQRLFFKVPLVPFLPAVSILINICLMMMLDEQTWIRFAVWMVIGGEASLAVDNSREVKGIVWLTRSLIGIAAFGSVAAIISATNMYNTNFKGLAIYFGYSIWNSHERPSKKPSLASIYGGTDIRPSGDLAPKAVNS